MYYDSNKGEEQEESQALFPPLMHRRERKGDGDEEEEEEAGEDQSLFECAHLGRRTFVLFIRSQRDGLALKSATYWIGLRRGQGGSRGGRGGRAR